MEEEKSGSCCCSSSSSSSSSSSIDFNPCPICLGPVRLEAYLDQCFHKYCYNCIARWAKFVAVRQPQPHSSLKCPFCKRDNFSIIYGCDEYSFQQHYINQDPESRIFFSEAHKYRLQIYYREPGSICDKFDTQRYWKLRRYLQKNKWFQIWLRREIQALIQEEDVDIIVHHILGVAESFVTKKQREHSKRAVEELREEFRALISSAARPFLIGRTDRFVNEMEMFLASSLTVEAYDEVYLQSLGLATSSAISEPEEEKTCKKTQGCYLHFFAGDSDTE